MKKILIIAGSDSGAGAGIQADIKTSAAHGVYASSVITSITAQNTLGVQAIHDLPVDIIKEQITSIIDDIGADVVKIGMLSNVEIISAISEIVVEKLQNIPLVIDPVMVAKGGSKLLFEDAIKTLKIRLLNQAYIITPNIPEAEVLSGIGIKDINDMQKAANKILSELSPEYLLIKGGHLDSEKLTDILFNSKGEIIIQIDSKRIKTKNTHGTGCTYSSAIASNLATGYDLKTAVSKAHDYVSRLIKKAPKNIGSSCNSHGPLWHFA